MTAKTLIKKLQKLPPNTRILISNEMGYPAHDYEGTFLAGFNARKKTITIRTETPDRELTFG